MKYRVELTPEARQERRDCLRFWQLKSKRARVKEQIQQTLKILGEGKVKFRLAEVEPWHSQGIHCAVAGDYLIYYLVDEDDKLVLVNHIIHGARSLSPFLQMWNDDNLAQDE